MNLNRMEKKNFVAIGLWQWHAEIEERYKKKYAYY